MRLLLARRAASYAALALSPDRQPAADISASLPAAAGAGNPATAHRHEQPEVYVILEGSGVVAGVNSSREVSAGDAVFLPGDAPHSIRNSGPGELRLAYVLAADSFTEVSYRFES